MTRRFGARLWRASGSSALVVVGAIAALAMGGTAVQAADPGDAERAARIKLLVQTIAAGNSADARDAQEQLIHLVVDDVATAAGAVTDRPAEQRMRVIRALQSLGAALRARVFAAGLSDEDRVLYESFAQRNDPLVRRAFADSVTERVAAVRQIPLTPESGAGVLLVGMLYDSDENVIAAALERVSEFDDSVVNRGLVRFMDDALDALDAEVYGGDTVEIEIALGAWIAECAELLAKRDFKTAVPAIVRAVEYFHPRRDRAIWDPCPVLHALGRLGEERAAPLLLDLLDDDHRSMLRRVDDVTFEQRIGDAALYALLRIYGLDPHAYDFHVISEPRLIAGFVDDRARAAARARFHGWYAGHMAADEDAGE